MGSETMKFTARRVYSNNDRERSSRSEGTKEEPTPQPHPPSGGNRGQIAPPLRQLPGKLIWQEQAGSVCGSPLVPKLNTWET